MTSLEDVADELYGLPPQDFTPAREARARQLRADEGELARAVRTLRRPTVAAWLVDLLVRERRDEVEALLSLGDQLREAQEALRGDALRRLGDQRRAVVGALVRAAVVVGQQRGRRITPDTQLEVEATLEAALADPAAAAAVGSGRLVKALSYAGLGPVADIDSAVAVPVSAGGRTSEHARGAGSGATVTVLPATRQADPTQRDDSTWRRAVAAADRRALEASGAADDAQCDYERRVAKTVVADEATGQARQRVDAARATLEEGRARLAEQQAALEQAERAGRAARGAVVGAERAARRAHQSAAQARAELDRLRRQRGG